MSSRVIYNEPVSATEHDATPDSPGQTDFGANRQGNGTTGKSAQGPVITCGKSKGEATGIILEAANGDSYPQEPDHSSTETVTTSTIDKPAITMNQLDSQSTSASAVQTPVSTTSSRRSSNHATSLISSLTPTRPAPPSPISTPPSRRGSKSLGISLSNTSSSTYLNQRSPSHKTSTSSIRKTGVGDGGRPNVVRRQSSLAITYTASPSITPIDREKEGDARELMQVNGASSTANPASTAAEPVSAASVAHKILDPLSALNPTKLKSGTTTSTPPTAPTTSNTDSPLRRNFSSTSASTSGASTATSDSSNPVLRHATELELAYGIIPSTQNSTSTPAAGSTTKSRIPRSGSGISGTHTPFSTRSRSVIQSLRGNRMHNAEPELDDSSNAEPEGTGFADLNPHDNVSNIPPPKDASEEECGDIAWALAHTVIVKDFGFEEGDERFDRVPDEALLGVLRPPKGTSEATRKVTGSGLGFNGGLGRAGFRSAKSGRSSGRGAHYGGAAEYGGRWEAGEEAFEEDEDLDDEYDEDEDDDGWGFPMGTVSGGPAPLGTTLLGSRRELKNRVRTWNGLGGSKGVGGRWVAEESSEAEGESSGFYEEGEGVSGGEGISGDDGEDMDPKDGDDDGLELDAFALMHTPSKAYRNFIGDEGHVSGRVEPSTYPSNSTSAYISGSQLTPAGHMDVDGVDADDDEGDSTDSDDTDRDRDHSGEEVKPGMYRALYAFEAEGSAEMSVVEGQMVRVLGGSRDGWAIAERTTHKAGGARAPPSAGAVVDVLGEEHGLVPLGYLEVSELDSDGDL